MSHDNANIGHISPTNNNNNGHANTCTWLCKGNCGAELNQFLAGGPKRIG